ncbi:hypothetical protein [Streptomyces sp. NPDC049813]|uniref:hypothetical protein n=1 Tax=Streptomyces sp. NPDC049813 TaxID=3365597 RepID=UPI0037AC24DE
MKHRIATALAVATVAGFLAAGPAAAFDGPDVSAEGRYHSEGWQAGRHSSNVGGPLGVTNSGAVAGGFSTDAAFRFERDLDLDHGFGHDHH